MRKLAETVLKKLACTEYYYFNPEDECNKKGTNNTRYKKYVILYKRRFKWFKWFTWFK